MKKSRSEKLHDSGHWFTLASALVSTFGKNRTYCDVGCGAGFLVKHLKNLGVKVVGFDSEVPKRKRLLKKAEILELPTDKQWDVVCCWNELSKLHEKDVSYALKGLFKITRYILVVSFTTSFQGVGVSDKHIIRSLNWWKDRLEEVGFKIDETVTRRWVEEYKWHDVFVCIK